MIEEEQELYKLAEERLKENNPKYSLEEVEALLNSQTLAAMKDADEGNVLTAESVEQLMNSVEQSDDE